MRKRIKATTRKYLITPKKVVKEAMWDQKKKNTRHIESKMAKLSSLFVILLNINLLNSTIKR